MYNPALCACALLLLLPTSNVIAQTTDSTDILPVRRDSCAPRGNLSMLVAAYINITDLEELNAVLAENGYPEFDEVVGGPLYSTGIDLLVHSGLSRMDISGSYRLLAGRVNTVQGSADYRGTYFSFGMGSSIPIARRLRISLGCVWEFSIIEAQLQSGGFDSIPWNTGFDSAIRNGQQDDRLRMLSSFQIAFAPAVNVHWRAFTRDLSSALTLH